MEKTFSRAAEPLVSVVITTKNEEKNIGRCLEGIKQQTYKNIEVIVVDNYSSDKTKEICSNYEMTFHQCGPERSSQRNVGIKGCAKGEYVIYVDADMIFSPDLIKTCVDEILSSNVIGFYINEIVLGSGYFSKVRRFERGFYNGTSIDGIRFFKRNHFVEAGGFDEKLFTTGSGEDWDLDKTLKKRGNISLLPSNANGCDFWSRDLKRFISSKGVNPDEYAATIFHNESEFELFPYLKKKKYYAKGFEGYIRKWGKSDADIRKQFGFTYRFFTVFTEQGKYKILMSKPHLAIGMYFLRFLVGITFLFRKKGN
ncbi:glycosyltransferase [Polynucleobacter wuianus]|uniref:glycosyltransferase family 2 protein n=1 Tax=Polynucleobacter wuianus TaxID=1743168 RepID=UPI001C0D1560|nr:glycosyltransferase [Polynucleobacter wuianus]MBU3610980.1 glycosyltransferase [Polynucleobacter wuianus]